MPFTEHLAVRLAISLGIGLLIGAERERRKGTGPSTAPAGIRTFALVSFTGGISVTVGGELLLAIAAAAAAALSIVSYKQKSQEDPGFTTAIALLTSLLLAAAAGLAGFAYAFSSDLGGFVGGRRQDLLDGCGAADPGGTDDQHSHKSGGRNNQRRPDICASDNPRVAAGDCGCLVGLVTTRLIEHPLLRLQLTSFRGHHNNSLPKTE